MMSLPTPGPGPLLRVAVRDLTRHRIRTLVALLLFALPVSLIVGFASLIESDNRMSLPNPVAGFDSVVFNDSGDASRSIFRDSAAQDSRLHDLIGEDADDLTLGTTGVSAVTAGERETTTSLLSLTDNTSTDGPSVRPGTAAVDDRTAYVLGIGRGGTLTVGGTDLTVTDIYQGISDTGLIVNASDALPDRGTAFRWYLPAEADGIREEPWISLNDDEVVVDGVSVNEIYTVSNSLPDSPHLIPWGDLGLGALRSSIGYYGNDLGILLTVVAVAVMAVTLISAVITPVFAVAARRLRHQLALLATHGATPAHLRRIMLYEGLIVGTVGSALGLVLSTGVGAAAIRLFSTGSYAWAWDVAVPVVAVALVCGVASALVPAVRAGRENPVTALSDGSSTVLTPWRPRTFIGLPLVVLGVALAPASNDDALRAFGIALAGIGLVCSAELVVRLVGATAPHLSTAGRLAVRDTVRNRHRTVPAVAAVSGVTMLVTMLVTYPDGGYASDSRFKDTVVTASATAGGTADTGIGAYSEDLDRVAGIVGTDQRVDVYGGVLSAEASFTGRAPQFATAVGQTLTDPIWQGVGWSPVLVTAGDALSIYRDMTTADLRDATDLLASGTAVVGDPALVHDGRVRITVEPGYDGDLPGAVPTDPDDGFEVDPFWYGSAESVRDSTSIYLPAVVLPGLAGHGGVAVSPDTAESVGLQTSYDGSVFLLDHPVSTLKALEITARTGTPSFLDVSVPALAATDLLWSAVPVLFSLLTTGATVLLVVLLAASESRRDLATITALGAPPGLLRRFTATQALVVAGAGTVAGVVVGATPALIGGDLPDMSGGKWLLFGVVAVAGPVLARVLGSVIGTVSSLDRAPVRRRE